MGHPVIAGEIVHQHIVAIRACSVVCSIPPDDSRTCGCGNVNGGGAGVGITTGPPLEPLHPATIQEAEAIRIRRSEPFTQFWSPPSNFMQISLAGSLGTNERLLLKQSCGLPISQ